MLLSVGIVLFSLLIGGIIIVGSIIRLTEAELGQRLMTTARTVAEIPLIQKSIREPDGWRTIAPTARRIRIVNDVTYVVVMDMNRVRYSDPLDERIGTVFLGKDAEEAFAEHTYIRKVRGELGTALRAYVPIMNTDHQQVGVVMVGHLLPSIPQILYDQRENIAITFFLSLLFGIWGSYRLARHMKRQMLNLEPEELARMLVERTATFHAMREGVIAIDTQERITIVNDKAKQIFNIEDDVLGRPIREVIPDTALPEVLEKQQNFYDHELHVGGALIWSNRFLIRTDGKVVGALAIFQDRTEVARMAEELTGVKAFVDALRVQNHEYMNKLHTIAGLLQLNQKEKALQYLFEISEQQEELTAFLSAKITDESVSGLLLGKVSRGKELGIRLVIDRRSNLERFPPYMDHHNFVLILGNLIENAFDALEQTDKHDKEVYVSIEQDDDICSILVEDNGIGMDDETRRRMLERGFSTKAGKNRGLGLYLVQQLVAKGRGELSCQSQPGEGTSFLITFPMKEAEA
ncbi:MULTISPECIES: sensor histidine kinase [Brevibacillus]|jgi:two-component system, CitB family, sensor histidine kinase DctS|uniref:ATP-binding protein n=1 Tax=Brevibacillus TaxID=55080 RepID=UPI000E36F8C7|nr:MULTISPECIES: sensor histidine kinase [Bacillales]MBR8659059.1 sensor histidine kinase [Brevibacillus sp. NL20B1]REK62696.1 MAG: histidine kinase [Brevibacillus sp.]UFJ59676.1 sensor histidine kinase [Anoxybacillus sediminis]